MERQFIQTETPTHLLTVRWDGSGHYGVWVIDNDIEYIKLINNDEIERYTSVWLEDHTDATVSLALQLKNKLVNKV